VSVVHAVWPDGVDDPARPSGGNVYDRRLSEGLTALGWTVHEHLATGPWPQRDAASLSALGAALQRLDDGTAVLIDGLIASAAPEALEPHARRLALRVLVHMPFGDRPTGPEVLTRERAALATAGAIVTTSAWARARLRELYPELAPERILIARPGVDAAEPAPGSAGGGELLCVAAVTRDKGHDLLLDALTEIADLDWRCVCVGSMDVEPQFAATLRQRTAAAGLGDRIAFPGPRVGDALERVYAAADLCVLASRAETYGMVLAEALAHGLPVLTARVGGVTEAIGDHDAALTVAPDEPKALAGALRNWLSDPQLRTRLRVAARARGATLPGWDTTAAAVAEVLR
jgi:glycosyltransferase involved in cell wall biosynthesis